MEFPGAFPAFNYFAHLGPHKFYFTLHTKLGKGFGGGYILPVCIIISVNSYTSSLVYCFVVLIIIVNVISLSFS